MIAWRRGRGVMVMPNAEAMRLIKLADMVAFKVYEYCKSNTSLPPTAPSIGCGSGLEGDVFGPPSFKHGSRMSLLLQNKHESHSDKKMHYISA